MRVMQEISKKYLGMARQWDTAQLNLKSNKGGCLSSTLLSFTFFINFLLIRVVLFLLFLEHLSQVTAARYSANARVTELEKRVAALEKEAAASKKEIVAAIKRAKKAENKEQIEAK